MMKHPEIKHVFTIFVCDQTPASYSLSTHSASVLPNLICIFLVAYETRRMPTNKSRNLNLQYIIAHFPSSPRQSTSDILSISFMIDSASLSDISFRQDVRAKVTNQS